jgi:hypothetical protein
MRDIAAMLIARAEERDQAKAQLAALREAAKAVLKAYPYQYEDMDGFERFVGALNGLEQALGAEA